MSSDEENAQENVENDQVNQMTLEEKEEKATKISTEKILTQEDFKKIRLEQLKKKVTDKNFAKSGGAKKRKVISIDDDEEEDEENAKAKR